VNVADIVPGTVYWFNLSGKSTHLGIEAEYAWGRSRELACKMEWRLFGNDEGVWKIRIPVLTSSGTIFGGKYPTCTRCLKSHSTAEYLLTLPEDVRKRVREGMVQALREVREEKKRLREVDKVRIR